MYEENIKALDKIEKCVHLNILQKKAWRDLHKFLEHHELVDDNPDVVVYARVAAYVFVPSLLHSSIRSLFLNYFKLKGVNINALNSWLSEDQNLRPKVLKEICVTQNLHFNDEFLDAVDFFMSDNENKLTRNVASHNILKAIKRSKMIVTRDILSRIAVIMNGLASFDTSMKCKENKMKLWSIRIKRRSCLHKK